MKKLVMLVCVVLLLAGNVVNGVCPKADLTGDCKVNLEDLAVMASEWLTEGDPEEPGNSMADALDLGAYDGSTIEINEYVALSDWDDYYRFTVTEPMNIQFSLPGRVAGAQYRICADVDNDLIWDGNETLESDSTSGTGIMTLYEDFIPGVNYYIHIYPYATDDATPYILTMLGTPLNLTATSDPGDSMATAYDLGAYDGNLFEIKEVVANYDWDDYYHFTVTEPMNIQFSLPGRNEGAQYRICADVDNDLIWDGNETLESDSTSGTGIMTLYEDFIPGVNYYIHIYPYATDDATPYILTMLGTPLNLTATSDPGDSMATAYDLGAYDGNLFEIKEVVANYDWDDYYHFTVNASMNVQLALTGLNEGARIYLGVDLDKDLIWDGNETLESASTSGTGDMQINDDLVPGEDYFIKIIPYSTDDATPYVLKLTGN